VREKSGCQTDKHNGLTEIPDRLIVFVGRI